MAKKKKTQTTGLQDLSQSSSENINNSTNSNQDVKKNLSDLDTTLKNIERQLNVSEISDKTAEQKQESKFQLTSEEILRQVKSDVNRKMDFYRYPPRFLKPVFFLDSLTPYLKVTLITDLGDPDNPQKRMELFDTLSQNESTHNHLSKFTYESNPEANEIATISINDVEQNTVDQVLYLLASLQNGKISEGRLSGVIYIEIKFGWAPDAQSKNPKQAMSKEYGFMFKQRDINQFVKYTKTIYIVPGADDGNSGISIEYSADGIAKMTIKGTVDQTFPDPYKSMSPFSIFGPMPAVNLTLYNLDKMLYYFVCELYDKTKKFTSKENGAWTIGCYHAVMCNHFRLKNDAKMLNDILSKAIKFYCTRFDTGEGGNLSTQHGIAGNFVDGALIKKNKDLSKCSENDVKTFILFLKSDRFGSKFLGSILNTKAGQSQRKNAKAIAKQFVFCSDFCTISGDGELDIIGHQTRLRTTLKEFKSLNRSVDSLKRGTKEYSYKEIISYYQAIGMIAQEMKLHPYYLYSYIMQGLSMHLKQNKKEYQCELLFLDYGALNDNIIANQDEQSDVEIVSGASSIPDDYFCWSTDSLETTQYKGNVLPFCKSGYKDLPWEENEGFYEPAHSFNTSFTDSWSTYLSIICSKIQIDYAVRNETHAKTLVGEEETEKARSKTKKGTLRVPIRLKQQMFLTGAKDAMENIYTQYVIVSGISQVLEAQDRENGTNEFGPRKEAAKKYLEFLKKKYDAIKGNSNKKYIVCIRDVVSTDSIFDADMSGASILQTFSYRLSNIYDGQFDPGIKSCWTVNYPDILEFNPNYNAFQAVMGITTNAHFVGDTVSVKQISIADDLESFKKSVNEFKQEFEGTGKTRTKEELSKYKTQLESFKNDLDNYKRLDEVTKKYGHKYQLGHYGDTVSMDSNETHAQSILRSQQTLRRRLLLGSNAFDATLKVLGDANFDLFSRGKNIFLKFINNDGTLGYFTGVYNITGVQHDIEIDKFVTTLKLTYTPILDSSDNSAFEKMIYHSDILSTKTKINPY